MHKFEIGQRVRLIESGGYNGFGEYGATGECGNVVEYTDYDDAYEVAFDKSGRWWAKSDNLESVPVAEATGTALTIREGAYYLTRDGRKVGPMKKWWHYDTEHPWEDKSEDGGLYRNDGTSDYEDDLISESPAPKGNPAAEVDNLRDEYGPVDVGEDEPKFRVGDVVENPDVPNAGHGVVAAINNDGTYQVIYESGMFGECRDPEHTLRLVAPATSGSVDDAKPTPTTGFTVPLDAPEFAPVGYGHINTIADIVRRLEALEADKSERRTFGVGDNVILDAPAKVTGIEKKSVNIVLASGGSYALPLAALRAA